MVEFADNVIEWYREEGRDFPWRELRDPYRLLLTEILLIRTRAAEVEKMWEGFFEEYPDIDSLSSASEEEIREEISSLGLAWRAEEIEKLANELKQLGEVPDDDSIFELSCVGKYVGNSVLCFAFEQKRPVIDSNVQLVLSEMFDSRYKDLEPYSEEVVDKVRELMPENRLREFYFGLIDLGALIRKSSESEIQKLREELRNGR